MEYLIDMPVEIAELNKRVLVVEDDRAISRLLKHNIEDSATVVTEAPTGLDGIKAISEARVDLVILDLRLPDFDGWGVLSLMKLTRSLCDIPVVIVSVEPPKAELIDRFGPKDYIQKPFDTRDLVTRIHKVMNCT